MNYTDERIIDCAEFEERLTDYLDGTLERPLHKAVAAHALRCPLCHSLLNEVRDALEACHEISAPKHSMTHLEARILSMTMPETAMTCEQFEEHLTDYLDGFLPATLFHRWERHAVLCDQCTDLPGAVVRSIAACYTYKTDELMVPAGLHERILQATIGTTEAKTVKASWTAQLTEWVRSLSFPIAVPQFASVVMMLVFAAFIFSQTVSAGGPEKIVELAEQTYQQSADVVLGKEKNGTSNQGSPNQQPVQGTYVNQKEESK
ncbi:MAG: zf-HC2 domain-containing protein [Acidobacteria bacterium]|nr:zf-HC2 domain-containing protein [Acidobacteriota bacterium]